MTHPKTKISKNITLKDRVISESNIFNAIHSLKSYVFEETLLCEKDLSRYHALLDEFNEENINQAIRDCRKRLNEILNDPGILFKTNVFFKLKKYDSEKKKVVFRPIHCASLIDMICMAAMLQILMFEDGVSRELSDLSKKIPHNFFGNKPSKNVDRIFERWQDRYAEYNHRIVEYSGRYRKSHEFKTEVTLDIKNFFPSIPPEFIISYCCEMLSERCNDQSDIKTLRTILEKLVYIKLDSNNIKEWGKEYYILVNPTKISSDVIFKDFAAKRRLWLTQGVAQGLPQSYFFGNLCMVVISNLLNKEEVFKGDSLFYVDDSVIYIKSALNDGEFSK